MKKTIIVLCLIFCCIFSIIAAEKEKGPFGTTWLSSKEEVEEVGKLTLIQDYGDYAFYYFTPNKGHSAFESYLIIIIKNVGLVKIVASGTDINCTGYGTALKNAYSDMKNSLIKSYGPVTKEYDFNTSSLWTDADDWMYALYRGYRYLTCYWDTENYTIGLDANASSSSVGYITLTYEHNKWGEFLNNKTAAEDNNL